MLLKCLLGGPLDTFWALGGVYWESLGALGEHFGALWGLPEHLREALRSSREALGIVSECFWDVSGKLLGLRESVGSGQDKTVKINVFLKEFVGF